jgi:hypothetical protein
MRLDSTLIAACLLSLVTCILDRDYYEYLGTLLYNLRCTSECYALINKISIPKAVQEVSSRS